MDKTEKMFSLIDEYRASGCSMRDFAEARGIKLSTFTYWARKKKQAKTGNPMGKFIPLTVKSADIASSIEIVYPNGVRIITWQTNIAKVQQLVKLY